MSQLNIRQGRPDSKKMYHLQQRFCGILLGLYFVFHVLGGVLIAQDEKSNQEKTKRKTMRQLEKEGNDKELFKRYRSESARLDQRLRDLKLERMFVKWELKNQLLQVVELQAKLKDAEDAAKEIELASLEVLKIDIEDGRAKKYFREQGNLDETIAKLKQQGFPKEPVAKEARDRKLGLPPQPMKEPGKQVELKRPVAPGAPPKKKGEEDEDKGAKKSDKESKKQDKKPVSSKTEKSKRQFHPVSVRQVMAHHRRQFRAIDAQEKNVQTSNSEIQTKWIKRLKQQIRSGTLTDQAIEKAYRQIRRLDKDDADAKSYFDK